MTILESWSSIYSRKDDGKQTWIFEHVERRLINFVVNKVDHIDDSQITRVRERLRKTIRETTKQDLKINELDQIMIMVYDRTLITFARL